uniref:putative F-box protein At2g02030 n=1 Tax=Erigeron canadensis TaxID=72917 RepID=UPI001CB8B3EB|nr:putative F-box protein At2g02030 [Erigeron canadensis]
MTITVALLPAAQRKRKRSAASLHAAQRRQKVLRPPPPVDIDNNLIEFEKKKADHPSIDIDNSIIEYEILPRLPAKSVGRFKSVSKQWNSFLSTHMFGKMHHLRHINNKTYKLLILDKPLVDLCSQPLNNGSVTVGFNRLEEADPRFDSLLGSLDGLVCVASTETVNSLALWNPFTGAYYKLPPNPSFTRPFNSYKDFRYRGRDVVGFYSDSSNDYKLLYMIPLDQEAYIYSQRLNSWRKIEFLIDRYSFLRHYRWSRATFCDHSLYFSVKDLGPVKHPYIICFDVNTEEFRVIQFPPLPSGARCMYHANFVGIDGCIHLCAAYYIGCPRPFNGIVWKLNGDGATWAEVAFYPGTHQENNFADPVEHATCVTRNARDTWLAISDGGWAKSNFEVGPNSDPFEIMSMEEFTLTPQVLPMWTYSRIIYDETLVSPYPPPPYGDMVGHSNDVEATVVACKL